MKQLFYFVVTAAIFWGLFFPPMGNFSPYIPVVITFLLFFNFLGVKVDPSRLFRKELFIPLFLSSVIMPVIANHGLSVGMDSAYRIGLLLSDCAPSGIMGIVLIRYMKHKDYDLAFSNFLVTTFGSILLIQIILKLLIGQSVTIDIRPVFRQTAVLVITPFLATRLVNHFSSGKELRNTLTFISSSRNLQIVLAVAILNFPPLATVPIIIAIIFTIS